MLHVTPAFCSVKGTAVAAYLIASVDVINPEAYREYRERFDPILERFGGRILVAGGKAEPLEGEWAPARLVVLEFPDIERAKAWYQSPEYAGIVPIRFEHAETHFLTLFPGWEG